MADTQRRPRRSRLILAGVLVVVVVGAAAFVWASREPATMIACELAAPIRVPPGAASPEEAARAFQLRTGSLTGTGAAADTDATDGGPLGFARHSRTEWRRDLGDGRYQRLVVEEFDDGWHVVDANACSESPA